jgi:chromosome segregation ATPase
LIFNKEAIDKFSSALNGIKNANGLVGDSIDGVKRLDDMAKAIDGLSVKEAILALTSEKVNDEDQKSILLKAGLITETEAESFATNKNTIAKGKNLSITKLLSIGYKRLAATIGISTATLTAFIGVAVGIVAAVVAIEKLIVTEEELNKQLEELNSKWNELSSTISESAKAFQSLKTQSDEMIPRYAKLAQGVDRYGKNVSLTDEEFSEFISLNNQLGEMFPELVIGYDSNSNAILSLSGNVDTLTESLYACVEAQRLASAQTIADTMPDVIDNITETENAYKNKIEIVKKDQEELKKLYESYQNGEYDGKFRDTNTGEWRPGGTGAAIQKEFELLEKYGIKYKVDTNQDRQYKILIDWEGFETSYDGIIAGLDKKINDFDNRIGSKWKQLNPVISSWLSTDYLYQDFDAKGKSIISSMVGEIDFKSLGMTDEEDIKNYITNTIINPIYDMDYETQQALFEVLDVQDALYKNEISVREYQDKINSILKDGNFSQEFITLFKLVYDESDLHENIANNFDSITGLSNTTNQGKYQNAMAEARKLEEYTKDFTQAEWEKWFEVTKGVKGATKAIKEYEESLKLVSNESLSITDTINKLSEEFKPAFDDLKSVYKDVFSLDDDGNKVFDISNIDIDTLSTVKSAIDSMNEIEGVNIATETYEEFVKVLTDTSSTAEDVQNQFNNLVSELLNQSNIVEVGSNVDILRQSLEQLGVVNVDEVLSEITEAERKLTEHGIDLENVTNEQIEAFIREVGATDIATQYLEAYVIQKEVAENPLSTAKDIENLESLCKSLGTTGEMYEQVTHLKYLFSTLEYEDELPTSAVADIKQQVEETQAKIRDIANSEYSYEFNFDGLKDEVDEFGKSTKELTKDSIDWIEKLISRINRTITNLGKTVSATYKQWSTRNNALAQEMQAVNQEISIQQKAYEAYMAKANSIPLPEAYKELVRNGGYRIEDISDEGLRDQIKSFEEWYEKALSCYDAIEDLRASLAELAMTKFDNISAQFDNQMSMSNHNISMLEGYISQAEAAGMIVSEEYYKAMIEQQESNVSQLKDKYSSLLTAFDEAVQNGSIEKYSEDWYEMLESINGVELEIQSATTELIEFNQALQQLSWATFDRMQGYIGNITSEAEFLIDMLDEKDLFDDKGNMTERGLSVQGLHAVNYNVYMAQAQDYADEIAKLNEEIAKDPYDMELIDRRNELIQSQQDAIANAMKEKEAILALIEEGYNKMLESLQELIDKRKEALQAEKDLYSYQQNIAEKTDNIAKLRKQLQAYAGDNSESAKAKIQELQTQLEEAEKDLQETEYDKWLSDQEEMLDNLYDQTQDWVNERLDNIDVLIEEAINATNQNAETISNTIRDISDEYGYTLTEEMESIWDYESAALNGITDIVSLVGDKLTTVNFALDSIGTNMQNMINSINNFATQNANSIAALQQAIISGQPSSTPTTTPTPTPTPTTPSNPGGGGNSGGGGNGGDNDTSKPKDYYIVDRTMKMAIIGNLTEDEAREMIKKHPNGAIVHKNHVDSKTGRWKNSKEGIGVYATGTKNAKRGLGIFGEAGDEILVANDGSILLSSGATLYPFQGGETVFNAKDTSEILKNDLVPLSVNDILGKSMTHNINGVIKNASGDINQDINVSFSLPNVTDANTLITELQHNKRFEKVIQSMTADGMLGKNSLNKYKF